MSIFKKIFVGFIAAIVFTTGVEAASGSITASTSTKTAAVGSTFTVTVKVSCSEAIGSWQFGIAYDRNFISLVSGDTSVAGYGDGSKKTQSYTYKFKAIKSGSASVSVSSPSMVSWNDDANLFTPSSSGVTVTVKTQSEIEASYSKDNFLKSLVVDGYELNPGFDKDTTAYTVSVPDTVEEIKVSASPNDSRSRVSGTGTIDLSEGTNKVEIVVTAQNGAIKTYTLTVDVKDLNPIEVEVGGQKYSVVKKSDLLTGPAGFSPLNIKINDIEVPAFHSELAGLTVLGLKDENGNIGMFVYDEETNSYKPYKELKGTSLILLPQAITEELKGFTKTTLKIEDTEYEALKGTNAEDFILLYAMNIENGQLGYYIYDSDNHSFISYNKDMFSKVLESSDEYKLYLLAAGSVAVVLFLLTIILGVKNSKLKKIIKKRLVEVKESQKLDQDESKRTENKKNDKKKKSEDKLNKDDLSNEDDISL
ncbi:MAG TPA: hypothetical protein DCY94_02055 [Firmicutes bacterium]|nr:hypothetical protein [Bacillota bacterium]